MAKKFVDAAVGTEQEAMTLQDGSALTLTNTEATGDNFQVFLKPRCDPAVTAFGPVQWRLDRGQIILMSRTGETWQFEADDNAQWRRVPDSADGLVMLRGQ